MTAHSKNHYIEFAVSKQKKRISPRTPVLEKLKCICRQKSKASGSFWESCLHRFCTDKPSNCQAMFQNKRETLGKCQKRCYILPLQLTLYEKEREDTCTGILIGTVNQAHSVLSTFPRKYTH